MVNVQSAQKACNKCPEKKEFGCSIPPFEVELIDSLKSLTDFDEEIFRNNYDSEGWIFRGQLAPYPLQTSIERACKIAFPKVASLKHAPRIEEMLVREFKRWYDGEKSQDVRDDMLFCLSLMQHHGAPTRLLDWTYSIHVALYFAIQYAYDSEKVSPFSIWCLQADECYDSIKQLKHAGDLIKDRRNDKKRQSGDKSFRKLYMRKKERFQIILPENPYYFHKRLYAQQAVFLCPGDVSVSFENNIKKHVEQCDKSIGVKIKKYCCNWDKTKLYTALETLRRRDIYRATLFPDLDGFSQSLKYRLPFYSDLHKRLKAAIK